MSLTPIESFSCLEAALGEIAIQLAPERYERTFDYRESALSNQHWVAGRCARRAGRRWKAAKLNLFRNFLRTTMPTQEILEALPQEKTQRSGTTKADVVVIGAGPTGLACAIEAQKVGAKVIVVDKGCLVNSLYHYPPNMVFFTTPELLEIGDIPFTSAHQKPTREEALVYYRRVADHYKLDIRQYEQVTSVEGKDNQFRVNTVGRLGLQHQYRARKVIIATGYYDLPNRMEIPGEDLPKVNHYYSDSHPYYDMDVLVIGGKNSSAIASLDRKR